MKAHLKTNPKELDWNKVNIADIGYRLVQEKQQQYVGEKVASWDLDLKPRPDHWDKRVTVATPLQKAGAYLVVARLADGSWAVGSAPHGNVYRFAATGGTPQSATVSKAFESRVVERFGVHAE